MNGKNIGRTVSWVYYKDEKLIGGSAFDIQLFQQILENNAKFSSQAQEMIETQNTPIAFTKMATIEHLYPKVSVWLIIVKMKSLPL